jgi:hypothetical protein
MKKERHFFTLPVEVNEVFEEYLENKLIDKSKLLTKLITNFLIEEGEIKE